MAPRRVIAACGFICAILATAMYFANQNSHDAPSAEEHRSESLTVDETVGTVLFRGEVPFSLCRFGNPAAVATVRKILENQQLSDFHTNAIVMLGYIGDAQDVERLKKVVGNLSGELTHPERLRTARLLDALGLLHRRGIDDAGYMLDSMMYHEYWDPKPIKWYANGAPAVSTDADVFVRLAMNSAALSRQSGLEERIEKVLAQIPAGERRDSMALMLTPKRLQRAREEVERAELEPIPPDLKARLPFVWNGDHDNPLPISVESACQLATQPQSAEEPPPTEPEVPEPTLQEVTQQIRIGDPRVIDTLRKWLAEGRSQVSRPDGKLNVALDGLAAFGDRESFGTIREIYEDFDASNGAKDRAAIMLSRLASTNDTELLQDILWNQTLSLIARCESAKRLSQLGDGSGNEFLLEQYDLYRLEHRTRNHQSMGNVRFVLTQVYDSKLIDDLIARLPNEPSQTMKNNIQTLVERMRMNNEPIDRLKELAADALWNNASMRYQAVEVLGQKGTPDLIPFLESLAPFEGDNIPPLQHRVFREEVDSAIGSIRRRNWSDE